MTGTTIPSSYQNVDPSIVEFKETEEEVEGKNTLNTGDAVVSFWLGTEDRITFCETGDEVVVTEFRVGMEDATILGIAAMPVIEPLELSGSI